MDTSNRWLKNTGKEDLCCLLFVCLFISESFTNLTNASNCKSGAFHPGNFTIESN